MKTKKLSIKWSVFLYILAFAAVILVILWLCQVAFLEDIYKSIKTNEMEDNCGKIITAADEGTLDLAISEIAKTGNTCIRVAEVDRIVLPLFEYDHHCFNDCVIHNIGERELRFMYESAQKNGGVNFQRFMYDSENKKYIGIEGGLFEKSQLDDFKGRLPESIIYSAIVEDDEGRELYIMLNSEITPVEATVQTLNKILGAVSVILILLALILALIISHRVTKPIRNLTYSAIQLAKGNYDVTFTEEGYKEATQLSQALNYAESELSRADKLRRELIANISHDLRTPLTMIGGYGEMMRDIPGENTPENVQVIIDETKRLTSLVNDVLDISKLESGVESMNNEPFCLTESVKELLERFRKLCERDGYNIEFLCDKDVSVYADKTRITQVIYNLVGNAITHTGDSKNVIVRQITEKDWVRVEVEDFGDGIEPKDLPLIWERYYKVDKVHRRAAIGTGLGLCIVRQIMELCAGRYGVSSAVGEGSCFFIELPVYQEKGDDERHEE